jgi:two-component system, LytTR family, response regulator
VNNLRVLIVDDEPLVRAAVRSGLSAGHGVEIIGECATGSQAIDAILACRPDLVLLDIEIDDCTGLDVVRRVGANRMPAVVFVTAYDQYAVTAFELNAVDYLLKPFDEERLWRSIERARERINGQTHISLAGQLQALLDAHRQKWPQRIAVRNGERFDFVLVDAIDWIESANNYVQLHCNAKPYLLGETLTHLQNRLDPSKFVRIHRRRIINLSRLVAIYSMPGGTYEMELRGGIRLSTGRQYKEAILALMKPI